jgi:hypothetical protein
LAHIAAEVKIDALHPEELRIADGSGRRKRGFLTREEAT